MNYGYILEQTSESLYTSVRMYDTKNRLIRYLRKDPELQDEELTGEILASPLLNGCRNDMPVLFSVNQKPVYAWIVNKKYRFLLGPILLSPPVPSFLNVLHTESSDLDSLTKQIPETSVEILAEKCALLYNAELLGNEKEPFLEPSRILFANFLSSKRRDETLTSLTKTMFDHIENSFAHNPYNHEKLECRYIENGDVENLKKLLYERFPGRYGKLSRDPFRQEVYLSIVAITIACRAAIAGGMYPETAFSLSDVSIQRIDSCKDPIEILQCTREAELHFARLVRDLKKDALSVDNSGENEHITHCKDYIFSHLHGKITVSEIADAIGLEVNYLSSLFKRHEHISLKAYILEEKVKLIKNLLTYSSYSFTEISAYLGFASQSHMGMEFKKITGMTLRQYRSRYSNDDFLKESMILENLE